MDCKCLSWKVHRKHPLLPSPAGIPLSRSSSPRWIRLLVNSTGHFEGE
jgi:hypothetical protein